MRPRRKAGLVTLALSALAGGYLLWQMQPWMPGGHAVSLGTWQFEEFKFEVWQRKNSNILEPFATGVFVRKGNNSWAVCCIDIQDHYSPRIDLHKDGSKIVICHDGEKQFAYDLTAEIFSFRGEPFAFHHSEQKPPGDWWLSD